ncbi:MAG: ribonuclease H-like domain-containing protein [Lachnospiraceae bacterium]|nr:ribonuclease H-like domain-containing protein [Lachnospiraceae bacterium]
MITREDYFELSDRTLSYIDTVLSDLDGKKAERLLFFDIETTGLKASTSFLYLIGCMRIEEGRLVMRQFLAEDLGEEALLIESFLRLTDRDTILVDFNGEGFDVPYLAQKSAALNIFFPAFKGIDLYKHLRPFKNFFGLNSMRQKSIEGFLGFPRKDEKDGGELIDVYRDFLVMRKLRKQAEADELLALLLLHNHDDVLGLFHVLPALFANALHAGCFEVRSATLTGGGDNAEAAEDACVEIRMALKFPAPKDMELEGKCYPSSFPEALDPNATRMPEPATLRMRGDEAVLYIPVFSGELKLFFENVKDYFYLPSEDRAIHKSLAAFIDKSLKVRAKTSTCYEKRAGSFLPAPKGLFDHELVFTKKDRYVFVPVCSVTECTDMKLLEDYAAFFLKDGFF